MPEIFILLGVPVALLLFALPSILVVWLNISSLGTQYSRGRYWLWSIILLVIMLFLSIAFSLIGNNTEGFVDSLSPNTLEFISRMGERGLSISVFVVSMLPTWIWQNVLANRIRDYGGNPWLALWGIVPLVNVFVGLYYGIARHKASKAQEPSLAKAVYNHGKDIASEVKPAINDYKQRHQSSVNDTASVALDEDRDRHSTSKHNESQVRVGASGSRFKAPKPTQVISESLNDKKLNEIQPKGSPSMLIAESDSRFPVLSEDEIYEKIMLEIDDNEKVRSTWAKALAQSEGDMNKAKALYINFRFELMSKEALVTQEEIKKEEIKKEEIKKIAIGNPASIKPGQYNAWIHDKTGLMWEIIGEESLKNRYTHTEAMARVKNLNAFNYAGFDDWRLPNVDELASLCTHFYGEYDSGWKRWLKDKQKYRVNGNFIVPPLHGNLDGFDFWSNKKKESSNIYYLRFDEGNYNALPEDHRLCVRCVRGGLGN